MPPKKKKGKKDKKKGGGGGGDDAEARPETVGDPSERETLLQQE